MQRRMTWNAAGTPAELRSMLKELGDHYPISQSKGSKASLTFEKVKDVGICEIAGAGQSAAIRYSTPAQAGRAVGALLGDLVKHGKCYSESTPFTMLGIMLDCSRNAVMTVDHLKVWLRRLSLLGYNMVMLYTEDTYELPDEPMFGYKRGAYTKQELKQIDAYAAKLNIEIIPCIQTLGHCAQFLKHREYSKIRDTREILLVGEKETYKLIDKMVSHWKSVCRTDRIHVGMDETHGLGTGKYRELNGTRDPFKIFNEHLAKVVDICKKHGLKPMIWSDMYFRLGSKTNEYYDKSAVTPPSVIKKIHKDAELVYWDYYHNNKEFYLEWIKRHRAMGKEPLVGSGIWTWNKFWHDKHLTETMAGPCIDACYEAKISELFFTQWGDNGAFCDFDSAFCGMTWCADKAYGIKVPKDKQLEKRFAAVCGGSYAIHHLAGDIELLRQTTPWDDPLYEEGFRRTCKENPATMAKHAKKMSVLAGKLRPHIRSCETGSIKYAFATANALAERYALAADLLRAYRKKDRPALLRIRKRVPKVRKSLQDMELAFRTMWISHNKPQGLEATQKKYGEVDVRYVELARRLDEYLQGKAKSIPELERK